MLKVVPLSVAAFFLCLQFLTTAGKESPRGEPVDPAAKYTPIQLIRAQGYPAEEHWVATVDGYILGLHRIPAGRNQTTAKGPRPVFFLQHGVLCSSTNWIINLANESLAYILADHGYDVWMGNVRGNTYSRNHTSLAPNTKQFWNFTFDEHAQKDLPAMVDYVLNITGQEKLFYVGHSQGTIMGFAGFSFNQTLANRIHAFFALAPVATVKHIKGLFRVVADFSKEIEFFLSKTTDGEFLPNDFLIKFFARTICPVNMGLEELCGDITFLICGYDTKNLNLTRLPVYYSHTPAGTSLKNAVHFAQEVKSGRFAMYDYGSAAANIRQYGVNPSPAYDVSTLKVPMALFTGGHDWLADPTDVGELLPVLNQTGYLKFHKTIPYYSHLDFIWGVDAAKMVYADMVTLAQKFLPG